MHIQTYMFSNGTKALLQRKGNQSIMQILDKAGNIIKTRCKSISRTTVPVKESAPVRTSIGFIPQQLKSHVNDKTRLQIGFLPVGEKRARYKIDLARNKFITTTKTDFDADSNVVNISNTQRRYNPDGEYIGTFPVGMMSNRQISELNQQQGQVLKCALDEYSAILSQHEANFLKLDETLDIFRKETKNLCENQKEIENLLQMTENETNETFMRGIFVDTYSQFWKNEIAPLIERSSVPEFAENPCTNFEKKIADKLNELIERKENLQRLLSDSKSQIEQRMEHINMFSERRDILANALEQIKMHYTETEFKMRQTLCDIQRKITSIITKQGV